VAFCNSIEVGLKLRPIHTLTIILNDNAVRIGLDKNIDMPSICVERIVNEFF